LLSKINKQLTNNYWIDPREASRMRKTAQRAVTKYVARGTNAIYSL